MKPFFVLLALTTVLATLAPVSQGADGSLSGVVRDASGAVVPKAQVTVALAGSARREFAVTRETGDFSLSPLPEGRYTVSIAKPGFALVRYEGIEVGATPARMEVVLNLGKVTETLEVVAERTGAAPAPASTAGLPQRIRIGGGVQATKLIASTRPVYPPDCKVAGVEGTVLLRAVIAKDGSLLNLETVNRLVDDRLVTAAMDAVRTWRYQPTLLNGEPVEVVTEIQVNFTLSH